MEARETLPDSRVVAAFQTISAHDLLNAKRRLDSDVVVCSDDEEAKAAVAGLAEEIPGISAVDGGGLRNAVMVEHITPLLLNINRVYGGGRRFGLREWGRVESGGKKVERRKYCVESREYLEGALPVVLCFSRFCADGNSWKGRR